MPTRKAIPLHRQRQAALIRTLDPRENGVNQHKGMATHLLLGTGMRNNTCGHAHESWFRYINGELYIQIPAEDKCRKDTDDEVCGECDPNEKKPFYPKTPASKGRMIQIRNKYHNYVTKQDEYFGLKDRCENYFAISPPDEEKPAIGFDMIQANGDNGVSLGTINDWIREVCVEAGISKAMRETRLEKELGRLQDRDDNNDDVTEKIADHGTDEQGRPIPDVFAHDLRASFCTQMCRDESPNYSKIKTKTGHKNETTLYRYVGFAGAELDTEEDANLF